MVRPVVVLLLVAALAAAQGSDALVERVVSSKTSPTDRSLLIDQLLKEDAGADALAKRALDPAVDPEIVHLVVDKLFLSGKYGPRLGRVVLLLVQGSPEVQRKVRTRIQRAAEQPETAPALRQRLREVAEGRSSDASGNGTVRLGAVRALASVPHREALEAIVAVWRSDADPEVQAACKAAVQDVLPVDDSERAEAHLRAGERITWSYADFLLEHARKLRREFEKVTALYLESLRQVLTASGADRALEVLEKGDVYSREVAAQRLLQIVREGDFTAVPQEEAARRTAEAFGHAVRATLSGSREGSLPALLDTMAHLGSGGADAPLWKVADRATLLQSVQALTEAAADQPEAGLAAVRLISVYGDDGIGLLRTIAQGSRTSSVRERAGRALADRARANPLLKDVVGRHLVELLLLEKDGGVRNALLQSLREAPVEQAVEPLRMILFPDLADPRSAAISQGLAARAPDYCMAILRQVGSPRSFELLVRAAQEHARPDVRKAAMQTLLERGAAMKEPSALEDALRPVAGIALAAGQPAQVRAAAVAAIADLGLRAASAALESIRADPGLPPDLVAEVRAGQLRLAGRLCDARGAGADGRADFDEAKRLLALLAPTEPPDRVGALARRVVEEADGRSLPAGSARVILLRAYRAGPEPDAAELLRLYAAAAQHAVADGLPAAEEARLLREYRGVLPAEGRDSAAATAALRCSERLGELSAADPSAAATFFLDAAETAAAELKDREAAERNLDAAERAGAATNSHAERLRALRAAAEALPRKEPVDPNQ